MSSVRRRRRIPCIHHLALRVADPLRSRRFYLRLGLADVRRVPEAGTVRSVWLRAGDVVLMLERRLRGGRPRRGSGHLLAFAVPDLARWERRLRRLGIAIDDRTDHTLYFRDPDGHRIGLTVFPLIH